VVSKVADGRRVSSYASQKVMTPRPSAHMSRYLLSHTAGGGATPRTSRGSQCLFDVVGEQLDNATHEPPEL